MNKEYIEENGHHIQFRRDKKRLPKGFQLNKPKNKIPLPVVTHDELHFMVDNTPCFRDNLTTRTYLANMAYNEELDRIPEDIYLTDPRDMMRK